MERRRQHNFREGFKKVFFSFLKFLKIRKFNHKSVNLQFSLFGTPSLDIIIYQNETGASLGNCGQFLATSDGHLNISSNNCTVKLKPLCLKRTNMTVTEQEISVKRRKEIAKTDKHVSSCADGGP